MARSIPASSQIQQNGRRSSVSVTLPTTARKTKISDIEQRNFERRRNRADFVRKMQVCLKELVVNLVNFPPEIDPRVDGNSQSISIFVTSVKTAGEKNREAS